MQLKFYLITGIVGVTTLLSACTWVKLSTEAENVQIITEQQANNCKLLGHTTSIVKWTVATIARNETKVKTELETLARNSAIELQGNAIKPASEIKEGKQKFDIYHCDTK
ncbi:MAG: DUF4156 domain-containing protein [Gammaproteobacteria bacterium]|nr:DUF4156 domain-containing protein [Gammaproteobacteria bacterium]